jgi:DNA-binding response OmpR family regulator
MPSILIVEDEAATAWALAESLSDEGYAITTVGTAEEALAAFKDKPADLVITDVRLPRMDGVELARRLGARKRPAPVIVVSAYGDERVLRRIEELGVHAYFPKPFQMDHLRKSVQAALRLKAA